MTAVVVSALEEAEKSTRECKMPQFYERPRQEAAYGAESGLTQRNKSLCVPVRSKQTWEPFSASV